MTPGLLCKLIVVAGMVSACAPAPGPPLLGTEESFDGLRKVVNSRASAAWMRADFDISGYTKIRLEGAGIRFRPVRGRSEFHVTPEQEARLVEVLRNAFTEELAKSERYELTDREGPDVLTIWGGLLDVVSFVPPNPKRGEIYLRSLGEATLVIELQDSMSNATLARVLDRRAFERSGIESRSVAPTNWATVRRLALQWASLLRARLDSAHTWTH